MNGWGEIAALAPCILGSDRGGGGGAEFSALWFSSNGK